MKTSWWSTPKQSKALPLLLLVTLALAITNSCTHPETVNSNTNSTNPTISSAPPNTTFPMPPLSGKRLGNLGWASDDGKRTLFSEFKGKVLVLDFYATWCMPCRNSVPHLIDVQNRFGSQGVQVVGLNVGGPDDLQHVKEFASEMGIQYPLAVPDDDLSNFLMSDNTDIPQTFVFDRNGRLVRRFIGYGDTTGARIDESVEWAVNTKTE